MSNSDNELAHNHPHCHTFIRRSQLGPCFEFNHFLHIEERASSKQKIGPVSQFSDVVLSNSDFSDVLHDHHPKCQLGIERICLNIFSHFPVRVRRHCRLTYSYCYEFFQHVCP